MKAPDSIYIQTNAGEAFSSKWTTIPFRDFENTEYIRKDALMEWAEDFKAKTGWHEIEVAMDDLIDKLNSM